MKEEIYYKNDNSGYVLSKNIEYQWAILIEMFYAHFKYFLNVDWEDYLDEIGPKLTNVFNQIVN